jgi:hypothetical protein
MLSFFVTRKTWNRKQVLEKYKKRADVAIIDSPSSADYKNSDLYEQILILDTNTKLVDV